MDQAAKKNSYITYPMGMAIGKRMNNGIVIAVVIVLGIAALSVWQYWRIRETGAEVRHADSVCLRAGEVLVWYLKNELDSRKTILTIDTAYLPDRSVAELPPVVEGLRSLTVNDPDIRSRVDSLVALYGTGWTSYPPLSALGDALEEASPPKRIPAILTEIAADERRLLDRKRAANQVRAAELQWSLWALLVAVVVLAVVIFRKIRLELGAAKEARQSSEEGLQRLNGDLQRLNADLGKRA